jgi:hypothetical protein
MKEVRVLSIKQPWAFLIVHGYRDFHSTDPMAQRFKDIENRSRNTKYRGRFYIHASKSIDKRAMEKFYDLGYVHPDDCITGAIIGSADLVEVVTDSPSKWFEGKYGYVLSDPRWLLNPIPKKGKLGFWKTELKIDV